MSSRIYIALIASSVLISGCTSISKGLGLTKTTPNEFNILTKAPLVIPPEYSLRPPEVGSSNAQDNYSSRAAREALIGDIDAAKPSQGETILLSQAGINSANPEIRLEIDGVNGVERKSSSFADRILFWRNGEAYGQDGTILDADSEAARLESINSATGGGKVEIKRRPGLAKLPGL